MFTKILLASWLFVGSLHGGTITIAVAANVSYAMDELKKEFIKHHPDTKIEVVLGSSGKLTAQIKNGAPYGLFMAADMKYPQRLYADGVATTKPLLYAQGGLAMFSSKTIDFSKGLELLKSPTISKIAIANPQTAPYGVAAMEAMKNANVLSSVEKKFVFAESIAQTVSYAITAADIGFIAKSSLYSPNMSAYKENIHWVSVDSKLYTPIDQGVVMLKNGENNSEVVAFYNFILSPKAKAILEKFGYIVP
ncbi:MAG: molybdate ABC transporter substrate-binding protein [Sulfurovum sp. PC08-66]|jgi:molybdate transport system substrate-binding protein|nr:MAG: molybdate ABC transporter substrate-binding protein [Sulfurovum sp. PC08-66]